MSAVEQGPLRFKSLWVLMVTALVDMIGFALVVPLLPFFATEYGASASTVGLMMASFAFGHMITAPLWGRLSDRWGRKPVMIIGQVLQAIAFVAFAFAPTIPLLFLSRFLQGAGSGNTGAISAYVSDAVRPEERAQALGWITAASSAGVMIGPAIASLTIGFSRHAPGLVAATFCGLNLIFTWLWLRESHKPSPSSKPRPRLAGQILNVLAEPSRPVNSLILIYTAGMMSFMASSAIMALFLAERFGITAHTIGWFYTGTGAVSLLMRGALLGPLVRRFGEVRVLRLGAASLGIGMLGVTLAQNPWQFALAMVFIPGGTALLFPSTTSLISRHADKAAIGQTLGVQQSFGGFSRLAAPIWSGAAFQHIGPPTPFWIGSTLVFLTALFALRLAPGQAALPRRAEEEAGDGESV